jgi:hypothetical protein
VNKARHVRDLLGCGAQDGQSGRARTRPAACPPISAKTFDSKKGWQGAKSAFAHPADFKQ